MQFNDSIKTAFVSNLIAKISRCTIDADVFCASMCPISSINEKADVNFETNYDYRGNFNYAMNMFHADAGALEWKTSNVVRKFQGLCETLFKAGYFNELIYPQSKHKVAVVGSGPAGLASAFRLGKWWVQVDVYESKKLLGGLSRNSIPIPNIHEKLIDHEIRAKAPSNINFLTESRVLDVKALKEKYSAVIIAIGVYADKDIMVYKENNSAFNVSDLIT